MGRMRDAGRKPTVLGPFRIALAATASAACLAALPVGAFAAERNARVPLRNKMGSAWDVAHAALFLASDEAGFITGVALPVDGGASCKIG